MEARGQVCERRALPAGTGAKAHPGQMAAPETRWATGHQPSCPRATMGRAQRQAVCSAGPAGQLWARPLGKWHRYGGSHTLVSPKKHPSRVAPIGVEHHEAWCIAKGTGRGARLLITVGDRELPGLSALNRLASSGHPPDRAARAARPAWAGPQTSVLGMLGAGALLLHAVGDFRALCRPGRVWLLLTPPSLGVGLRCSWGPMVGICESLVAEASEAANGWMPGFPRQVQSCLRALGETKIWWWRERSG